MDAFCEICDSNHDASKCRQNPESSYYVGNYDKNQNQDAALKSLETQVGQISQVLNTRPKGIFPSDNEVAKGPTHEQCKAITTSGRTLNTPIKNDQGEEVVANPITKTAPESPVEADTPAEAKQDQEIPSKPKETGSTSATPHIKLPRTDKLEEMRPPPPFPKRMKKQKQEYQFKKLFDILKQHKKAKCWTDADIQGINPTICMHKILMEDDHKPTVDAQRKLNHAMKDVVRKEILEWLDAGIIYPISDSEWVSPVQCFPKKGACHLPIEIEHKAYWKIHIVNMDWEAAEQKRLLDLNELEEIRSTVYDNAIIYIEKKPRNGMTKESCHDNICQGSRSSFSTPS
ncbi:hypothetical protein GQ457_08G017400 [Hibiscus cannabinus]